MPTPIPTRQEMFDLAMSGLRAQEYRRAVYAELCVYEAPNGDRCAWGHVDKSLTRKFTAGVFSLANRGIGLAARLPYEDLGFASRMQQVHDRESSRVPENMRQSLIDFARYEQLVVHCACGNDAMPNDDKCRLCAPVSVIKASIFRSQPYNPRHNLINRVSDTDQDRLRSYLDDRVVADILETTPYLVTLDND